ncbi:hypothetical protein [Aliamphritea ceti]|uniref:hypothetical protein n=1 Tax=Aliamphritea ceti TaxID=1524258 RepID=UPI0021C34679|nr:hypothetical protein [Aliamphritea ceti]
MRYLLLTFFCSFFIAAIALLPARLLESYLQNYGISSFTLEGNLLTGTATSSRYPDSAFHWQLDLLSLITFSPSWQLKSATGTFNLTPALTSTNIKALNGYGRINDLLRLVTFPANLTGKYQLDIKHLDLSGCNENTVIQLTANRIHSKEPAINWGALQTDWTCENSSWQVIPILSNSEVKLNGRLVIGPDTNIVSELKFESDNQQIQMNLNAITPSKANR